MAQTYVGLRKMKTECRSIMEHGVLAIHQLVPKAILKKIKDNSNKTTIIIFIISSKCDHPVFTGHSFFGFKLTIATPN